MNINRKLYLANIIPLLMVLAVMFFLNLRQYEELSEQAALVYREGLIETRKNELKNLLEVARGAIKAVYEDPNLSKDEAQKQVKATLNNMNFGDDGYYFAYNYDGINIVLPGQEWRVGENMIDLVDVNGTKIIQGLINNARNGGGYIDYIFNQPSRELELANKLSYSKSLEKWEWIYGTGVYIDDINQQASQLEKTLASYIKNTAIFTVTLGVLSIFIIFVSGTFIRLSEKNLANKKLIALNERIFKTQEEERKRVARELHDGVSQTIASAKFSLETAQLKNSKRVDIGDDLNRVMGVISKVMSEVRGISHRLHPGLLEDQGLGAALDELGREYQQRTGTDTSVIRFPVRNVLSMDIKTALYRIAQEALNNVERHSNANKVEINMQLKGKWVVLEVKDNGQGFDIKSSERRSEGIGLRNMRERIGHFDGELIVTSNAKGTTIQARVSKSYLNYFNDPLNITSGESSEEYL